MQIRPPFASITLGWIGTLASATLDHVSTVIAIVSGLAALAASLYAIRVSRKSAKLTDLQIQEEEEKLRQLKKPPQ
jgi:hypothetical protein